MSMLPLVTCVKAQAGCTMAWGAVGRRCSTCQVLKCLLAALLASSGGWLQTQELLF